MADVAVTNTFTTNTIISSSQVNTNFSDLVNFINNRNNAVTNWAALAVTGNATIGGTFGVGGATSLSSTLVVGGVSSFADGTAALPSLTFSSDTNTGLYRVSADRLGISTNGTSRLEIYSYVEATASGFLTVDGSVGTPSLSFSADTDTGFYRAASGAVDYSSNGAAVVRFQASGIQMSAGIIRNMVGTVGAPTYTFDGDEDTGIYRIGANNLGIATAGTKAVDISSAQVVVLTNALLPASGGTGTTTKLHRTGTYTGNGGTQNIAHGLGATPDFVIIADNTAANNIPEIFITGMGSSSHDFNGVRQTNAITSVDGTNIAIGANNAVNQNTVTYSWFALKAQ